MTPAQMRRMMFVVSFLYLVLSRTSPGRSRLAPPSIIDNVIHYRFYANRACNSTAITHRAPVYA